MRSWTCFSYLWSFFLPLRRPSTSTLFPYTTLFRSHVKRVPSLRGRGVSMQHGRPSRRTAARRPRVRSEEHTSELQSLRHLVCRLLLEKKKPDDSAVVMQLPTAIPPRLTPIAIWASH